MAALPAPEDTAKRISLQASSAIMLKEEITSHDNKTHAEIKQPQTGRRPAMVPEPTAATVAEEEDIEKTKNMYHHKTVTAAKSSTTAHGTNNQLTKTTTAPGVAITAASDTATAGEQQKEEETKKPAHEAKANELKEHLAQRMAAAIAQRKSALSPTEEESKMTVNVAMVGNVDSGKSTLIGVLTSGKLDNGRGLARAHVFLHGHEKSSGRTSSISQHIMGFDHAGQPVHCPSANSAAARTRVWRDVVSKSRSLITFVDLCGHEKYLKTTLAGLTAWKPDYALLVVNSLAGIPKMAKEHLGVAIALEIPLLCVVTKVDLVPKNVLKRSTKQLLRILKSPAAKKLPLIIRSELDVDTAANDVSNRIAPIFFVSAVNGTNLDHLRRYLSQLVPRRDCTVRATETTEIDIDDTFVVGGIGIVVSGRIVSGRVAVNQVLLLGPYSDGSFVQVLVRSIQYKRVNVAQCIKGDSCAIAVRAVNKKEALKRAHIRRGMVLLELPRASSNNVAPEGHGGDGDAAAAAAAAPNSSSSASTAVVHPQAARTFIAEVLVLHHPTTIKKNYQAALHIGNIRQTAAIYAIDGGTDCLRTGDKATVRFIFLQRPEYIHKDQVFVFREGGTKGIGRVVRPIYGGDPDAIHVLQRQASNLAYQQHRAIVKMKKMEKAGSVGKKKQAAKRKASGAAAASASGHREGVEGCTGAAAAAVTNVPPSS